MKNGIKLRWNLQLLRILRKLRRNMHVSKDVNLSCRYELSVMWVQLRRSPNLVLIDNNINLSDVDKLRYLKGTLTKEANKLIVDIEVASANYLVAWELLKARNENKKHVVKRHMDKLFAIPAMKKNSYESLIQVLDSFERIVNMTKQLGVATNGWRVLLAHMLHSRLDSATQMHWEAHPRSTNVPKYSELITFLKGHALVLQAMGTPGQKKYNPISSKKQWSKSDVHLVNSFGDVCSFCSKGSHSLFKCDNLTKWSIQERYDKVKENKLCINCLLAGQCSSYKFDTNTIYNSIATALVKIQSPEGSVHWARAFQLNELLSSVGFTLRKCASNSSQILQSVPINQRESFGLCSLDINNSIKTLGHKWTPSTDKLRFCDASRLYDPLGLIGPTILIAKCFMQSLCAQQKSWDEPLEKELEPQ
uniref:Uncharacterized protein n=1 Tax=Anopheles christyi TaxID=43041 RepID=A0A182K8G2_9DIPT